MDNYNYPAGADTADAPWNQRENIEIERDCEVTETIARKVTLSTADYIVEKEWNDDMSGCTYYDTSDTDWMKEYSEQEYTVLKLIGILEKYIENDINSTSPNTNKGKELRRLLAACKGWEQVDLDVEEE